MIGVDPHARPVGSAGSPGATIASRTPPPAGGEDSLTARYDARATVYRDLWAPLLAPAGRHLVTSLATATRRPVRDILDLGSGAGTLLPSLAREFRGARITAVDSSSGMLALAPARFRRLVMDARDLDLDAGTFDLVVAAFMLFHLVPPIDGVREARRVLRPGGRFAALTWERMLAAEADRVWSECLDDLGAVAPPALPSSSEELDTGEKLASILRAGGFARISTRVDPLEVPLPREDFLLLRQAMGADAARFRALPPTSRLQCLTEAARRLEQLPEGAFTFRGTVVQGIGEVV